jgi:hypothetical protein
MAEDDDRPGDASSAADASWADVVVPDDISALAADIDAYRRELRRDRRRAWQARVMSRPGILPLSIVSIALILAALVATLLTVLAPSQGRSSQTAQPLASTSLAPNGDVHGLVPQVTLSGSEGRVLSTALRPSVLALVPAACGCTGLLNKVAGSADSVGYPLNVVAASSADASGFTSGVTDGKTAVFFDPAVSSNPKGSLYTQMSGAGLTLVVVVPNGKIYDVYRSVTTLPTDLFAQLTSADIQQRTGG